MTSVQQLQDLAASVANFQRRPYNPDASYCRFQVYGQSESLPFTEAEFHRIESDREDAHIEHHVARAGSVLNKAFAAGLFDTLAFCDLLVSWERTAAVHRRDPRTVHWSAFFHSAVVNLHELQTEGVLTGTAFNTPPWVPGDNKQPIDPFRMTAAALAWWGSMMIEVAHLVDRLANEPQTNTLSVSITPRVAE